MDKNRLTFSDLAEMILQALEMSGCSREGTQITITEIKKEETTCQTN